MMKGGRHFILIHGVCHGGWIWYKVTTLLRSFGHRVTPIDLAAAGINLKTLNCEVSTFEHYNQPLLDVLDSLPPDEKVILVGHSLGGISAAMAMDRFPEKVAVGVFLTAFMPDSSHSPYYVLEKHFERNLPDYFLDTHFATDQGPGKISTLLCGPRFLAEKVCQLSPPEDLTLGMSLIRDGSLFQEDLSKTHPFSSQRYGSVSRVYIICDQDLAIPQEFQRWMIENHPVQQVMEINGSDHTPMFCKPQEVCKRLMEIAEMYE